MQNKILTQKKTVKSRCVANGDCFLCVALYVLYPYLTIHMRELGISVEEAAIMSAVTPIVAIIMPPIAGVVADRIGNFKVLCRTRTMPHAPSKGNIQIKLVGRVKLYALR